MSAFRIGQRVREVGGQQRVGTVMAAPHWDIAPVGWDGEFSVRHVPVSLLRPEPPPHEPCDAKFRGAFMAIVYRVERREMWTRVFGPRGAH